MKKVLITGANSYIGTSFEKYAKENTNWQVDTLDMLDPNWDKFDFSKYDSVFHVAGIAHSDNGKISEKKKKLYYSVNTDLTIATAKLAKQAGVKQFIFMSSAIVYGNSAPIGKKKVITRDTLPSPANAYGDSKLQAENGILPLSDDEFKVVVLRPPMIYGEGCKGNYQALLKFARKLKFFPYVKNERSMLDIERLCSFVSSVIDEEKEGLFFPQDENYYCTSLLVKQLAKEKYNRKIYLVKGMTWLLKIMSRITGLVNKAFGNLSYDMDM